jgi:hypothetical protein
VCKQRELGGHRALHERSVNSTPLSAGLTAAGNVDSASGQRAFDGCSVSRSALAAADEAHASVARPQASRGGLLVFATLLALVGPVAGLSAFVIDEASQCATFIVATMRAEGVEGLLKSPGCMFRGPELVLRNAACRRIHRRAFPETAAD